MKKFYAIGLMSGTSLDGLDICYASFEKKSGIHWDFEILASDTYAYSQSWENRLRKAPVLGAEDLFELNADYGFYLGEKVQDFIRAYSIKNLNLIASHGHTVFHQPSRKFSVQIGDGRAIKTYVQVPVIYDFRSQDVLLGGKGAPLVPIGDRLLFSDFEACLNIGGFSNLSFEHQGKRIAFDVGPVNIVLNEIAQKFGFPYDQNGHLANSGTIDKELLKSLNNIEYYHQSPPKSLGKEWVENYIYPLLKNIESLTSLATFTEHAATQIAETFDQYRLETILFSGGGTYNSYLLEKIKEKTDSVIIIPESNIINFKEALIFAFMGVLRLQGENNVLSSATGSAHDHSSGIIV